MAELLVIVESIFNGFTSLVTNIVASLGNVFEGVTGSID